jgi:hypothetical protein
MIVPLHRAFAMGVLVICMSTLAKAQGNDRPITLSSISTQQGMIATVPWMVTGGELLCAFTQIRVTSAGESGPARIMTVYRQQKSLLTKIFQEGTEDSFMNAFPLGEFSDRLLVGWVSGSAHHFTVYSYVDGRVKKVLEASSKGMPEILYDRKMQESLLFTTFDLRNGQLRPISTDTYRWDGKGYQDIGATRWSERLRFLSANK